MPPTDGMHWHEIFTEFKHSLPQPPDAGEVRNWNSVHSRRKHYRGVVHRSQSQHFVVTVEALEEIADDKKDPAGVWSSKPVAPGAREFTMLDWLGQLAEGQIVKFSVFPNPSVSERDTVPRVVQQLGGDSGGGGVDVSVA